MTSSSSDSTNCSVIIRPATTTLSGHVRQTQKPIDTIKGFCTLLFPSRNPPKYNHNYQLPRVVDQKYSTSQGGLIYYNFFEHNNNLHDYDNNLLHYKINTITSYYHAVPEKNPPSQLLFTFVRGFGNKFTLLF